MFLTCKPFVVIKTFSTGLVGVEVTSVSSDNACWKCFYNNERPTGQKQQLFDGRTVENKGKKIH
jgi:hypothetical protein